MSGQATASPDCPNLGAGIMISVPPPRKLNTAPRLPVPPLARSTFPELASQPRLGTDSTENSTDRDCDLTPVRGGAQGALASSLDTIPGYVWGSRVGKARWPFGKPWALVLYGSGRLGQPHLLPSWPKATEPCTPSRALCRQIRQPAQEGTWIRLRRGVHRSHP